jgi:hypothetical protein
MKSFLINLMFAAILVGFSMLCAWTLAGIFTQ